MDNKPWKQYLMTTEEAVEEVLSHLSENDKLEIAQTTEDNLITLHFRLGMTIRNKMGIWSYSGEGFPSQPDDISSTIIESLWDKLRNDERYNKSAPS
jgi:hypothetical protein